MKKHLHIAFILLLLWPVFGHTQTMLKDKPPLLFMPNVFTPSLDGLNDVYAIHARGIRHVEFSVFNRFHSRPMYTFEGSPDRLKWDGTHHNGMPCPEGVYVYVIRAYPVVDSLPSIDRTGTISIIRR